MAILIMTLKKIIKIVGVALFVAVFVGLFMYLFFESGFKNLYDRFTWEVTSYPVNELKIIEPFPAQGLAPTTFNQFSREILNNVYEPLIRPDRDLNMRPCLAISWGLLDDVTWEFNVRKDVKFHDGSDLDVFDVIGSIDRAKNAKDSELKDLLSTIKEVRRVDVDTIEVETNKPDPLLLQRLSTVYIFPDGMGEDDVIGTGSYKYYDNKSGERISLKKFDDYWGGKSWFESVYFVSIPDKNLRFNALVDGDGQILSYVPYDLVKNVDLNKFDVESVPSLEVQFLGFNFKSDLFKNSDMRKAVVHVIDSEEFTMYVGDYAHGVKQFVSSGVFGYNPDIKEATYDVEGATELVAQASAIGAEVSVILPVGLDVLGDYLTEKLSKIGLTTYIQYVKSEYLAESLEKMDFDIYFLGFKSELGDASDFLKSIVHTKKEGYGQYNFARYSNKEIDGLIEAQEVEMDSEKRLRILQDAMKILVEDEVFGVPLLEYDTLYSAVNWLGFEPRIDGFIYVNDL